MASVSIGVTSALEPAPDNYLAALRRYDAHPRILANTLATLQEQLDSLDGLLITGGTDVNPLEYGAVRQPKTDEPDFARDAYELAALRLATTLGLPVLMICRGMQIANTAFGGTLHQHIPEISDGRVIHLDLKRKHEPFAEHAVTLEADSQLAGIIGETRFTTNASHHQAIDRVGSGLHVVALADDGIVEALERPTAKNFWLAVQWHPERLLDSDGGRSEKIFKAFLAACR